MATSKESNENVGEIKGGHFVHTAIRLEKVTQKLKQRSPRNSSWVEKYLDLFEEMLESEQMQLSLEKSQEQHSDRPGLLFFAINTTGSLQCLFAERKYCDYSKI